MNISTKFSNIWYNPVLQPLAVQTLAKADGPAIHQRGSVRHLSANQRTTHSTRQYREDNTQGYAVSSVAAVMKYVIC